MGWSGDRTSSCDEDQTTIQFQNRVISCECLSFYHFLYLPLSVVFTCYCIITCDHLLYFTNLITSITSWDINECSLYLFSWFERLSTSFHVLVFYQCWRRPSIGYLGLWFDLIYWLAKRVHIWTSDVCGPCILILRYYTYTTLCVDDSHFRFETSHDVLDSNWIDLELYWLAIVVKNFMWTIYHIFNWWLFQLELFWISRKC